MKLTTGTTGLLLICILFFVIGCQQNKEGDEAEVESAVIEKDTVSLDYILGNFNPSTHPDFTIIDTLHADRDSLFLRKEAYEAFIRMSDKAKESGIMMVIRSATRNFDYQKGIWERKWTGVTKVGGKDLSQTIPDPKTRALKILEYSSMPGTSRHHWGTDIDLNNFENSWFESGEGLKLFEWLEANADDFGYCRPYTAKDSERPNGYNEEKWHWSYIPLAKAFTKKAKESLNDSMISGFQGAEAAVEIGVVEKYVLGINKSCL